MDKRKENVAEMFDHIAPKYDFLNRVLSMRIDKTWRRKLIKILEKQKHETILDIASGTGDLAMACTKMNPTPLKITGIDISEGMLNEGRKKIKAQKLDNIIEMKYGDSLDIEMPSNSFDAATVGFGVRNFENLDKGLAEIYRVLKPGGTFMVLEFSMPTSPIVKQLYKFYSFTFLPIIGRIFSGHSQAYTYLPATIEKFPYNKAFTDIMSHNGFINTSFKPLTLGIAAIYMGSKPFIE